MTARRPPPRRRGATLVEVLVATGLITLVSAGLWAVMRGAERGGVQVMTHASAVESTSMIHALFELDAAACVMPGVTFGAITLDPDGRALRFPRTAPHANPREAPPGGDGDVYVTWRLTEDRPGVLVLSRTLETTPPAVTRWPRAPLAAGRFTFARPRGRAVLGAEIELELPAAGGGDPRRVRLRWARAVARQRPLRGAPAPPRQLAEASPPRRPPVSLGRFPFP